MIRLMVVLFAALITGASFAQETTKLTALDQFTQQKEQILDDLKTDRVYKVMSKQNKKLVRDALDRMTETMGDSQEIEQLTKEDRTRLYNDQELVNTVLTMAENDNRQVCSRRSRVGTHFKTTECESIGDRRERQEQDRIAIQRMHSQAMSPPAGG